MGDVNGGPRSGGPMMTGGGYQPGMRGLYYNPQQQAGGYQSPGMAKGGGSPMTGGPGFMNAASQFMTQLGPQLSQMQQQGGNPLAPQIQNAFTAMRAQGGSPDINQFNPTGPNGAALPNFAQAVQPPPAAPQQQSGVANFQQHYNQLPAPPPRNVDPMAGRLR